jgi:hypothetical protein
VQGKKKPQIHEKQLFNRKSDSSKCGSVKGMIIQTIGKNHVQKAKDAEIQAQSLSRDEDQSYSILEPKEYPF